MENIEGDTDHSPGYEEQIKPDLEYAQHDVNDAYQHAPVYDNAQQYDDDDALLRDIHGDNQDHERLLDPVGVDVHRPLPNRQYSSENIKWKCCYHVYQRSLDVKLVGVLLAFFVLCLGEAVVIWFENRRSYGWCVLNTSFYPHGKVKLKECQPFSYLPLFGMMWSVFVAVLCICGTWVLQLFANARWLVTEIVLLVLALLLAVAGFLLKILGFFSWCQNLETSINTEYCSDMALCGTQTDGYANSSNMTKQWCYGAAVSFDKTFPQFVSMQFTFWMTILLMAILLIHVALAGAAVALLFRRLRIAKDQTNPTIPPEPAAT